jgi:outer membrane protein OmpA-like peptidoglycan-associated protein
MTRAASIANADAQRRLRRLGMTVFGLALASSPTLGASPTWEEYSKPAADETFRVVEFLDLNQGDAASSLVVVAAGSEQGVVEGTVFKTYRAADTARWNAGGDGNAAAGSLWVETGRLKTINVQETYAVARVESQGSELSNALFPKFPGVMAGDRAVGQKVAVARRQTVTPTVSLPFFALFADPKGAPASFELRAEGVDRLKEAAAAFAAARVSVLMIEGYTDHHGPAAENQVESYQRAMTVRQFLIDELGFDPERVVAIGYGEGEPADPSLKPGAAEANRRIVLKAVP